MHTEGRNHGNQKAWILKWRWYCYRELSNMVHSGKYCKKTCSFFCATFWGFKAHSRRETRELVTTEEMFSLIFTSGQDVSHRRETKKWNNKCRKIKIPFKCNHLISAWNKNVFLIKCTKFVFGFRKNIEYNRKYL